MKSFFVLILAKLFLVGFVCSSPPNFNYDFTGFTKKTQLLPTNCDDIEGQIVTHLGGIQKPTHNYAHIQCAEDENVGHRIKFIIHRDLDDDAITGDTHKQRLEMHTRFRTDLHALKGSTFIYAWWFFLGSPIVPDKTFWSIFQIKAGGSYAQAHHPNPDLTISLRSTHGLDFEVMNSQQTETEYHDMLPMDDAKGKWIQAFVKINYATNGYADVTLKGLTGNLLYHEKVNRNFWFEGSDYYGPKWGLYRAKSSIHNEADYMFFQNVQIWQK